MEQDGKWHCEYDKDGNLTERYIGTGRWLDGKKEHWKYRWNADGSLAKVVRPDGEEVTFKYDALGRRLSKSFGTTVTRWMWNGNIPLHQWKQRRSYSREKNAWLMDGERRNNTLWLFEEESFVPTAMIKEGKAYSILTDHLGTPTEAYDTEGNEVWSRTLDMNGEVIEENGNIGMIPFLFQGQYYDRETGLAYNRFRYYSPQMGMYISQDPIGLRSETFNLYEYVNNSNYFVDILGLWGSKKGQHTATVKVYDQDGNLILTKVFLSGNMTPSEYALGFPLSTLATHTEARAVTQIKLSAGQRMEIIGKYPPCNSCKGKMNKAVATTGASITYYWIDEESGKRKEWKAGYKQK